MRLEDDRLEALRRWGQGLRDAGGEEHAAAGRAILMLIKEIERLRLELLREQSAREDLATGEVDGNADEPSRRPFEGACRRQLGAIPRVRNPAQAAKERPHRRRLGSSRYGDRESTMMAADELEVRRVLRSSNTPTAQGPGTVLSAGCA